MANVRKVQVVTPAAAPTQAYADAERQRALADMLQKRALAPRDMSAMQGNDPYLLGLTQLGEALMARYANKGATQAEGAADAGMRQSNANAIERLAGAYQIDSLDGEAPTPLATGANSGQLYDDPTSPLNGWAVEPNQDNARRMAEAQASQTGLHKAIDPMDPRKGQEVLSQALLERSMPVYMDPEKKADRAFREAQMKELSAREAAALEEKKRAAVEREKIQREGLAAKKESDALKAKTQLAAATIRAKNAAAAGSAGAKTLPPAIYKIVDEASQAISTAGSADGIIQTALDDLKKVDLGIAHNAWSRLKNVAGGSDPASRAYVGVKQAFEKLRNSYLLLAKGVQTEGDATRAWNSEIGQDVQYDNALAEQQLIKAQQLISDMMDAQSNRIESAYTTYGAARPAAPAPATAPKRERVVNGVTYVHDGKGWRQK